MKRPSIGWSLPDDVATDVTAMSLMRIAIASPTSAPSTATGRADLVPAADRGRDHRPPAAGRRVPHDVAAVADRAEHRHVGPEQAVGERVDEDGLMRLGGGGRGRPWVLPSSEDQPPDMGRRKATSWRSARRRSRRDVLAGDHGQRGGERGGELRLGLAEPRVEVLDGRVVGHLDRHHRCCRQRSRALRPDGRGPARRSARGPSAEQEEDERDRGQHAAEDPRVAQALEQHGPAEVAEVERVGRLRRGTRGRRLGMRRPGARRLDRGGRGCGGGRGRRRLLVAPREHRLQVLGERVDQPPADVLQHALAHRRDLAAQLDVGRHRGGGVAVAAAELHDHVGVGGALPARLLRARLHHRPRARPRRAR